MNAKKFPANKAYVMTSFGSWVVPAVAVGWANTAVCAPLDHVPVKARPPVSHVVVNPNFDTPVFETFDTPGALMVKSLYAAVFHDAIATVPNDVDPHV